MGGAGARDFCERNYWNPIIGSESAFSGFFRSESRPFASEALSYDSAGNIIEAEKQFGSLAYGYDSLNQLTSMKLSENRDEFRAPALMRLFDREVGYDPDGNRTSDSFRGPAQFIDDQIVRYGNSEYQSDSQGFGRLAKKIQTSGLAQIYDYRADGEMTFFARTELSNRHGDPEEEQNSLFVQYYFDPLGRRVAKRIQARHDSFTQTYGYLGEQNKILLAKAGNGKKTLYMDGPGMDEHIGEISVDHALGYARDHLGSVLNSAPAGVLHASMPPSFWVGASPKSTSWGALLQCGPRFR